MSLFRLSNSPYAAQRNGQIKWLQDNRVSKDTTPIGAYARVDDGNNTFEITQFVFRAGIKLGCYRTVTSGCSCARVAEDISRDANGIHTGYKTKVFTFPLLVLPVGILERVEA